MVESRVERRGKKEKNKMKNLVNISEFPYGRTRKVLIEATKWLNANQRSIAKNILNEKLCNEFDYTEYWGMPQKIANKLTTDEVDFIQESVGDFTYALEKKLQKKEDFNFFIAYPDENGKLTSYSYLGELKYGNEKAAQALLKYVKTQSPKHKWNIVRV